MSMGWSTKRFLIAAAVVLAVHVAFIIFFGMRKVAFHEDEYITYATGAAYEGLNPYGPIQEKTGTELMYNFVMKEENRFRFDKVMDIQSRDVHPPLYHLSLHFLPTNFTSGSAFH